ncbi:grainyhead-like protein 3 homolog isoform X2 [Denticeps clupeoides]|uniref:grainyhead-like protein 3 homolog isoform X2 n=1 Tax=Denticeps clupeoides TaxID=299321 RepID=UPI0010A41B92|nr:grainyhead-like protein 3 homolog isoform X2 [Denticeps clupeoides]
MTKETETLVLQNECFNYPWYTDSYAMDTWNYMDSDMHKPKPRMATEEDLATLSYLYEQCKNLKDQKMTTCNSTTFKPERTPDIANLENSTQIMKLLSENISTSQQQEMKLYPQSAQDATAGESYEKQVISNMFDSLLQKWPADGTYPEVPEEALPYSLEQASPVYTNSYPSSPPEGFKNDFHFSLGAPQAAQHKSAETPMIYLNKGQFYPITLQALDSPAGLPRGRVKTMIMAVFDNEKSPEMQLKFWNHWHARQPTVKQRVIDIADYKETFSGISNVEEVAFNALSFTWNTSEEAKVYIGINSLSTDFSAQKGVKGLPLHLQIDTFDVSTGINRLVHRAACQVKIFCDKGAERKMRDEERKRTKKRAKNTVDSSNTNTKQSVVSSSIGGDSTYFKALDDHTTQPVLFIPEMHLSNMQRCGLTPSATVEDADSRASLKRVSCYADSGDQCSPPLCKQARREEQRVFLYVRRESEEVFDALMLNRPTLGGLKEAISEKYGLQEDTIGKVLKKCKRGIFVNMDDNIIEHYSNQSAFLIDISGANTGHFQITLTEL